MSRSATFDDLLDAVERLSPEEQADLVAVVQRRLNDLGRRRILDDARDAEEQFRTGQAPPSSVEDLMREIES
jgi:hypothetical protein